MSRKGVKARVVLARGAMFEFPDDGRKRYFNALDFLSSCHRKTGVAHQGAPPPPPFVWLRVSQQPKPLRFLREWQEQPGLKEVGRVCSSVSRIFTEIVSSRLLARL